MAVRCNSTLSTTIVYRLLLSGVRRARSLYHYIPTSVAKINNINQCRQQILNEIDDFVCSIDHHMWTYVLTFLGFAIFSSQAFVEWIQIAKTRKCGNYDALQLETAWRRASCSGEVHSVLSYQMSAKLNNPWRRYYDWTIFNKQHSYTLPRDFSRHCSMTLVT